MILPSDLTDCLQWEKVPKWDERTKWDLKNQKDFLFCINCFCGILFYLCLFFETKQNFYKN